MKSITTQPGFRWSRGLFLPALLLAGLSLMVVTGCEEEPSGPDESDIEAAEALVEEGFALLAVAFENVDPSSETPADFNTPKQKFEDALELDPENDDARLGLVLCEMGLMTQDPTLLAALGDVLGMFQPLGRAVVEPQGSGFHRALTDIGGTDTDLLTPGAWLTWMQGRMAKVVQEGPPPDFGPLQDAVETSFLPVVDAVIALLAAIESDPDWNLVLSAEMQGFENMQGQLEIDVTDILMIDTLMHLLKAQLHFFVSYNLNAPDFADTTAVKAALNQTDGTFLTLRTNGATHMGATDLTLIAAIAKMGAFATSLESETDDQSDDLIKTDGMSAEEQAELEAKLTDMLLALSGPRIVDDVDFDGDGIPDPLTVNLANFFNTPPADLKQLLPPYHWNSPYEVFLWNGWPEDLSQWVFPDPTMSGLFPALTSDEEFKAFFNIPTDRWVSPGPFGGEG
jgi:hypothetical protein